MEFGYKAGIHSVGSYQLSGKPWVTSSIVYQSSASLPTEINFPNVTRFVIVKNTDASATMRVGYSQNGVVSSSNYYLLSAGQSQTVDLESAGIILSPRDTLTLSGRFPSGGTTPNISFGLLWKVE